MPGTLGQKDWERLARSPRGLRILRFLKRKPQPAKLVGETEDGEEVTCAVNRTGPAQWTDAVTVLRECMKIQALDKEGAVLRVLTLDPHDPELQAEAETEQATRNAARGVHGSVPVISIDVPKLVDNIAKNLRETAISSAGQQAAAFKEGFAAMTSVVNLCLSLLVRVEERLEEATARTQQPETDEDGQRSMLVQAALQKALGANGHAPGITIDPAVISQLVQRFATANPDGEENGGS